MEKMENYGYPRPTMPQFPTPRHCRSGYEPSDTETEWQENSPNNNDFSLKNHDLGFDRARNKRLMKLKTKSFSTHEDDEPTLRDGDSNQTRNKSPLKVSRRASSRYEDEPLSRNEEKRVEKADLGLDRTRKKSPLKFKYEDGTLSQNGGKRVERADLGSDGTRKKSPLKFAYDNEHFSQNGEKGVEKADLGFDRTRKKSPLKLRRKQSAKFEDELLSQTRISKESTPSRNYNMMSEKLNYGQRSQSAPKPRYCHKENGQTNPSPLARINEREMNHKKTLSIGGELNEMVANAKISRTGATKFESTESISQGDIFFSKEFNTLKMATQKNDFLRKDNERNYLPSKANEEVDNRDYRNHRNSISMASTRKTAASSSTTSNKSYSSSIALRFVTNIKKSETEPWFSCLKSRNCRNSNSAEKVKEFDETGFIEKAFVVEKLRQFWDDKYQPSSLDGFTCHKQEAQSLKLLVSGDIVPHVLLRGARGSDKKALTMALLCEIFGDSVQDISHELRYFDIQENKPMQIVVPVLSSAHHMELNAYTEPNIRYALISLVKEISSNFAMTPDISFAVKRTDFKVIVLYDVDKATEKIQHLIKWIMDCYSDSVKLVLCCEDDDGVLNLVKTRCKFVKVDAPVTHEIMEVLNHIAVKEEFYLPMNFSAKIANKSRHNLRQAIMALEACRAHNYPFVDEQPIPLGWDEVVEDLAKEILSDPSHARIFFVRGRLQKLLVEYVHPKLILQGLVEHFLKAVDGKSKRELYYWHAYYEKRLPTGTSALLKLEEFVAKFMSMHRRGTLIKRNISGLTG